MASLAFKQAAVALRPTCIASRGSGMRAAVLRNTTTSPARVAATRSCFCRAMSSSEPKVYPRFNAYVKGFPKDQLLGDCPFCHRTMLTFEEKGIPYHKVLVNEYDMPSWIEKVNPNGAQIPIVLDLEENKWIEDSGKIVTYVEDIFPEPKIGKPDDCTQAGEGVFPAFVEFLKSGSAKGGDPKEKEADLVSELQKIEDQIAKSGGPYMAGSSPCAACFTTAPRLYHIQVACKAIKNWEIPSKFEKTLKFLDTMKQRDSWKKTYYSEQVIIDGWNTKLEMQGAK